MTLIKVVAIECKCLTILWKECSMTISMKILSEDFIYRLIKVF